MPELYGVKSCTVNAHAQIYLPYFVKQWGPLWTHSAFSFESMNGMLKGLFHSTRKVAEQLSFALDVKTSLQLLYKELLINENDDVLKYLDYGESHTTCLDKHTHIIGVLRNEEITGAECTEVKKLYAQFSSNEHTCKSFDKVVYKNTILHTSTYHETTKRRSCYCVYKQGNDDILVEIQKFIHTPVIGTIVFVKTFTKTGYSILQQSGHPCRRILETYEEISPVSHFVVQVLPMNAHNPVTCIHLTDITSIGVLVQPLNLAVCYFVKVPNSYEY